MKCTSCGADVPEGNQFCIQCGAPAPTAQSSQSASANYTQTNQTDGSYNQQAAPVYNRQAAQNQYPPSYPGSKEPITIGGWIGRMLIPYIPCVGSIVFIIMLFVWSGDQTKEETFRNWAKAQLIIMAVILGISLLVFLIMLLTGVFATMTTGTHSRYYY